MGADDVPDLFHDLALLHSNDEIMRIMGVDRETVRLWRRVTKLHRPRGIRTLPSRTLQNTGQTLKDLCRKHGWGSYTNFIIALRDSRPEVYRWARLNGIAKRGETLRRYWDGTRGRG